jgi:hypothetical protein
MLGFIRRQMIDDEEDGEEIASGNDGGDASGSLDDELLIQAARSRRVISAKTATRTEARHRDETLQSKICHTLCSLYYHLHDLQIQ